MLKVEMYSKPDCCLCDEAKAVLERVRQVVPFELQIHDITVDPKLQSMYGEEVPVVFVGGRKAFKFRVEETELLRKLERS